MRSEAKGWRLPGVRPEAEVPEAGTVVVNPRVARQADASGHNFFFPIITNASLLRNYRSHPTVPQIHGTLSPPCKGNPEARKGLSSLPKSAIHLPRASSRFPEPPFFRDLLDPLRWFLRSRE